MYYFQDTATTYLTVLPLFWTFCTANPLVQRHIRHKCVIFWRWKPGFFNTEVTFKFGILAQNMWEQSPILKISVSKAVCYSLHFSIYSECHCNYITIEILQQNHTRNTNAETFCQHDIQEVTKGNILQRLLNGNVYSVLIPVLQKNQLPPPKGAIFDTCSELLITR